ncbi:aspartate--tRNA(Asn) ligase [Clostridium polyendosporum]|uniref:Aspartate--tRNA(Asp/Asn) ligase n=1 Tax=Clostridium polyendosporum TaxID=69208 RepID=A0A919VFE0_9CLOT|nr:aspartate--tRNA(Asn) ligase [Clostridium polyendosporum]GIM27406.1 aspartate--tRNA(Asn) ligase [Clostridium polyendosporum]
MERTFACDVNKSTESNLMVRGWIHKIHDLGQITFIHLRDKTGIVQLVIDKELRENLRLEMSIEACGERVINEKAPKGVEIQVKELKVLGKAHYDKLPFEINSYKQKASLEKQLDFRSLSLRAPKVRAIFKVQEEIAEAFKNYLKSLRFSEIHTPKIISSSTEGGSEMFTVSYFDRRAFLSQSPQFYKQMMVGAGFERVFEIGHAYRAELHNTWRHLNEYVSLDVEMGFIKDEFDIMDVEEGFINYLYAHLRETCKDELALYNITLPEVVKIPRMPLSEAQELLLEKFNKKSPVGNIDAEGEIILSKYVKETYDSDFIFLTKYPVSKRPMYTMPDENLPGMTRSFDLIFKGLEITTGGQRIHDYEMLKSNIEKFGLNPDDFSFYLDSFRYGMPPHGGFAIGLERLTMKILGLENIREATLLPRDMKRLEP